MGFFGNEFVDVRVLLNKRGTGDVELTASRIAAIHAVQPSRTGGLILYFPPGRYLVERVHAEEGYYLPWDGDLVFGAAVTLWMESGAVLVADQTRVVINGGFVAPSTMVFEEKGHGVVIFGGEIEAIKPEWWGAETNETNIAQNTRAMQIAIDAGSVRRSPVKYELRRTVVNGEARDVSLPVRSDWRRPIPVQLSGVYPLNAQVTMGETRVIREVPAGTLLPNALHGRVLAFGSTSSNATSLQGVIGGGRWPTVGLRAAASSPASSTLRGYGGAVLRLHNAFAGVVQDIMIDAANVAHHAMLMESDEQRQMHSVAVRRCHFLGGRRSQLHIGPDYRQTGSTEVEIEDGVRILTLDTQQAQNTIAERFALTIPTFDQPYSVGDLPGLVVERCLIDCREEQSLATSQLIRSPEPRGIVLRAPNGVAVRISDCEFVGSSSAPIDARAIMALIEHCRFSNPYVQPIAEVPVAATTGTRVDLGTLGFEEPDGADVYLGADLFKQGFSAADSGNSGEAAVAVANCYSTSKRFFSTSLPTLRQNARSRRNSMIFDCVHQPTEPPTNLDPMTNSSVYWGKPRVEAYRMGRSYFPGMNPGNAFSVIGSWLRNGMAVWLGATQSLVLGCVGLRLANGPRYLQTRAGVASPTVTFGLTALAMLLCLLAGCADPTPAPADGGDAMAALDASVNDLGAPEDTATVSDDVALAMDNGPSGDASDAPTPAPDRPVIGYDVQIIHVPGTPTFESYGPPRQARRSCPAQTEGDPSIGPPRLIFPMSPMRVTSQRPTLSWDLPSGVTGASIELCRDPCCTQPITTLQATGSSVRPPSNLSPGVVFWRARGMVDGRVGREVSFTWEFVVRHRDTPTDTAWGSIKDFNGDGFDDLIMATSTPIRSTVIRCLWGSREGLFPNQSQAFEFDGSQPVLAVGDVNGDGYADVAVSVVSRLVEGTISIYFGGPSGLSLSQTRHAAFESVAIADLNGDGFGDLIVSMPRPFNDPFHPGGFLLYYSDESGVGGAGSNLIVGPRATMPIIRTSVRAVGSAGDMNGDGYGDIVVGDPYHDNDRGAVYVHSGSQQGVGGTPSATIPWEHGSSWRTQPGFGYRIRGLGDINGDRLADVLVSSEARTATYLLGDLGTHARLGPTIEPIDPYSVLGVGLADLARTSPDLDGDGHIDVVMPCYACVGHVYVFRGPFSATASPTWSLREGEESNFGISVNDASDLNGDGYDDLAVWELRAVQPNSPPGTMHLYYGGQTFFPEPTGAIVGGKIPELSGARSYYPDIAARSMSFKGAFFDV